MMSSSGQILRKPAQWRQLVVVGLLAGAYVPAAAAQDDGDIDSVSVPVVQAIPGGDSEKLNSALGRLGRNPRDLAALIDAGNAALGMGDADAAMGFFQRADTLSPGSSRIKAGIASAHVRREDPFTAIPLYAEAEKLGPLDVAAQLDRGLAYDLVGDNTTAQRYYRAVTALGPNDEAARRLALSLAISGDRSGMETSLSPLLQRQDKAAWRTRAFGLAVLGKPDEAESIAKSTLSPDLAVAMAAYLRYMPKLTPAQQAAAGNLGRFPRAAEIGRDDPRVALYAKPRAAVAAAAPAAAQPASRTPSRRQPATSRVTDREDPRRIPRGRETVREPAKPAPAVAAPVRAAAAAPPEVLPSRSVAPAPVRVAAATAELPPVAAPAPTVQRPLAATIPPPAAPTPASIVPAPIATPAATPAASLAPAGQAVAAISTPAPQSLPPPVSPNLAAARATTIPAPAATVLASPAPTTIAGPSFILAPPSAPAPAAPSRRGSLEEVFADLAPPSREAVPQAGAVDIRGIAARPAATARASAEKEPVVTRGGAAAGKPATPAKPAPPSHPSRIWVQLATGRDKAALGFDWRKFARDDVEVFKGRKPFTSAFGQSTRLITGPFETQAQATAFVNQLRKAGVNGAYVWTSPAGQVVDALAAR